MTKRELIDDVVIRLTGFKPSDDTEIPDTLVGFWIDNARSMIISQLMESGMGFDLSDYAVLFENLEIKQKDREMESLSEDKWFYTTLPSSVMSLRNDMGLISVYMQDGREVKRYNLTDRVRFKNLRFGKPSENVPTYTRRDVEIYFEGGNESWRENGRVSVLLVPENVDSLDEKYPIDSAIVPQVLQLAEEIGRRTLGIPQDLDNDGKDNRTQPQQ
jgi:hypothetical protein